MSVSFMCHSVDFKCEWGHFSYCLTRAQYCPWAGNFLPPKNK